MAVHPTTGKKILKAKFQIGSINGRMTYNNGERVFHPSDMPAKAKAARQRILAMTETPIAARREFRTDVAVNGTLSGKALAPWDDRSDHKYYSALEGRLNNTLIRKKRSQMEVQYAPRRNLLVAIADVIPLLRTIKITSIVACVSNTNSCFRLKIYQKEKDESKRMNGDWNLSSKFEKNHTGMLGEKVRKADPDHIGLKTCDPSKTQTILSMSLKPRLTLIQREKERMRTQRLKIENERKRAKFLKDCRRDQAEKIWDKPKASFDFKQIEKTLESTYTPDTLTKFLENQEEEKSKTLARKEFEATMTAKRMPKATVRGANLCYSVREGQAFKPRAGGSTVHIGGTRRGRTLGKDPTKRACRYEHLGNWAYSKIEDCEVWSCCMNMDRDSKGCTLIEVFDKTRWQYE